MLKWMTITADYKTSIKIYQTNICIEETTKACSPHQKKKSNRRTTLISVIRKNHVLWNAVGKIFIMVVGKVGKGQEKSNHKAVRFCGCFFFLDEYSFPFLK